MENQDPSVDDQTTLRLPPGKAEPPVSNSPTGAKPTGTGKGQPSDDSKNQHDTEKTPLSGQEDAASAQADLVPGLVEAQTVIRQNDNSGSRPRAGRTPAEIASVLVGERLNQYTLGALIGGGGMGAVFSAHDQRLDRIVALKVIPFVGNDPELQRRFRNEAQNAAKLDHPRIARVFDAGEYDNWHYIVFEYIDGTNLRDLVQDRGVLSLDAAVDFTAQVADALDHAAERGIVHRDIKPSNLLVSSDGSIKLVDMGLARSENLDLSEDMTASGVTLGTFDYISPEQAFDPRDADLRSDLYSLGCTFYFMVTGEAPYTGGTMLQKLISHGNAPPPNPQAVRPEIPDDVVAVMHRMMAKDPQSRYQNAKDLLADLNELAFRYDLERAHSARTTSTPSRNDGLQRLQIHVPWMIAVVLILMVGGYLELQSTATRDAWVINGPREVNRPGSFPDGSERSRERKLPGFDIEDPNEQSPVSPDTNRQQPLTLRPPEETAPSTDASPAQTDANAADLPLDNLNASLPTVDDPAMPPRLANQIPIPNILSGQPPMLRPDAMEPFTDRAFDGMQNSPPESSRSAVEALADVDLSDKLEPSEPSDGPASSIDNSALPRPQAVRVVASSQIASAIRIDQIDRGTDGAILVESIPKAMEFAMRFGLSRIEFATTEVVSGPFVIPQDNMEFVSTVGRTLIRMVSTDTLPIGRSEMIKVGNNRTNFSNLDFHWELAAEQVDGGAMFVVNDNRLTAFKNCTFTLVNKAIHAGVYVFEVITDPEVLPESETLPGRIFNPNENALPLVAIQFDDAIVRGEATLIRMDYAAALQLVWNNGLLAISGRMIETSGALRQPSLVSSPIQISLSNVTAEIPRGMIRMQLGPTGSYPVPIERESNQCVFLVDPGQPHFLLRGVDSLKPQRPYLKLRGEENAYVGSPELADPILSVTDVDGDTTTVAMEELNDDTKYSWIQESRPVWSVRWSSVRPKTQLYHQRTTSNYRQDGAIYFGFRELNLPPLPE